MKYIVSMHTQIDGSLSGFEADNGDGLVNEGILLLFLILAITGVALLLLLLVLALLLVLVVASVLPPLSLLANWSSSE